MEHLTLLAQTVENTTETAPSLQYVPLDAIWEQISTLDWLQAVIAVSFGVVYLMYGWRIFKLLVVICFALIGLFAGIKIGQQFDQQLWGGIIGLCVVAGISIPLMRWAVSILGAVAGGVLTGGIWYAFKLPEQYIWAGAVIGAVAGGMIAFITFKIAVMLFTSLGGGTLITTGMLSLFYQYEQFQDPPTENIREALYANNWFLPVLLIIPTFVGIILQNKFIKGSQHWDI
ncbi:MAG: hypothetical protein ACYS18_09635 [Planctomycetota bacterium]|jgi:hypothetical protein